MGGGTGSKIRVGKRIGQAHDRAMVATITAGREPRHAVVSQRYVWVELRQLIFKAEDRRFSASSYLPVDVPLLISVVILNDTPYAVGPSKRKIK